MANCTVNDLILSFDKEDRLRNTIGRVTGFDINKAYVLASFMQDEKFKKFLFDNLTEDDFLNGTFVQKENFTENDYVNIKQNKLGALLNTYYINTYHSVDNSKTNKSFGGLNGFSTGTAKAEAKKYTAVMIIQEYRRRFIMPTEENEKRPEIIKDVIETVNRKILYHFYDEVDKFAQNALSSKKYSKAAKEYAKSYIDIINKYNELVSRNENNATTRNQYNSEISDINTKIRELKKEAKLVKESNPEEYNRIAKEIKKIREKGDNLVSKRDKINDSIRSINKETAIVIRDKYVIAQNLVNLYSNNYDAVTKVTLKNYANLVAQTRGNIDNWYFQVFNTKAMTSLAKEFGNVDNLEAYMEQQDTNNDEVVDKYNGESIDETAKTWEDHLYTNFNQIINGRLRMILSTIPKLSQPYNYNSEVQAHDINNELGVTTFMDAQFVTNQIFTFGDFSSVDALIDSLEKKSRTIKSLYGIGQIVNMMKNDRCFANYVYANFAKPIVHKTILTISDDIKFDYSNPNAFHTTSLVFNMINKLKATYNTAYNSDNEITLDNIAKIFKNGKYSKSVTNDAKEQLYNMLAIYFPNFDKDVFNNYFDNNKESNHVKAGLLISFLKDINRYLKPLKQQINEEEAAIHKKNNDAYLEYKKYQKEYWATPKSERDKMKAPVRPKWEYVDYSKFKFSDSLTSSIIGLAKLMSDFTESKARLNTTNAEGNAASDVIKNCFVTRFFDQIMAGSETDSQAGLKALLSFITQGAETTKDGIQHVNQYSNNPLFFGLKDENGKVIYPGMFTRTATGYDINKHAKEILKYNLFDGTKNVSEKNGVGYASMSKTDFFITEYMAYEQSTEEIINDKRDTGTGYGASGVYPMRIGSDAPKIFFIRAPRYTRYELQYAFYNHLMNELTMFCNGLSNVMQDDGTGRFTTIKDVDGLLGRAFFHEKTADSIKQNNGTDFTKAITDGKRLRGNLFDFKRLFEVNGYKANVEIENILHLYGQDGLFIANKDGSLSLNSEMIAKKDDANSNPVNPLLTYDGTRFAFNLNENQKKALLDIVDKWMNNFVSDASVRTNDFIEVLKSNKIPYTTDKINMFLLNSANMNMNYDDLFEGDYKYYNNARDFLKRTKETQAGGDGYAGYDLLDDGRSGIKELKWQGKKDVIRVQSYTNSDNTESSTMENVTVDGTPLIARNGWKAVTIYNTNKPSDYAQEMQVKLESIFIEHGMQPELAKSKSVAIAKGYGFSAADRSGSTTKINDAQSYITLEEFIRRKYADGTLQDYADLIKQLTDSTPVEDIDIDKINARIQVQKNFYYDKVYDAKTNQFYPRQIKNAEYVLIPKLIKGTELEKVYNFMQKNGIGQLNTAETSKAAKKNVFTIWDAETGKFDENFESKYKPTYAEDYFYKNLYKQQDVPQHMVDAMNKAGSQIMKKIIDNIFNEIEANNDRRKELITAANNFQRAYTQNIKESFEEFLDNMGWAYDEFTGQIVNAKYTITDVNGDKLPDDVIKTNRETLNFSQFYVRARQEAARLGMDSNFMDYLTTNEFGVPLMPNCMNVVMNKLESVAQSIYNRKITRQELPGWHAAQITNVGYSKKLKFDAKTGVMEVLLPRWSKLIPRGKNAEEDAAILKQLENEGLDIHIGYRIPTEGKQSIAVLKVVGFVNDCLGSTIVVPDDWVTQTGSDFDVDSVYGISWEMYSTTKNGKIELHKVEHEEDKVDNRKLYIRYVLNKIDNKILKDDLGKEISTKMKELRDSIMEASQEEFTKASEEFDNLDKQRNELFNELPAWARGIIKDLNLTIKVEDRKNHKKWHDLNDLYTRISEKLNDYLDKHSDKLNEEDIEKVKQYIDLMDGLMKVLNLQKDIISNDKEEFQSSKGDAIQEILDNAINRKVEKAEEKAKEAGVISYEEFLKLPFVERLTRKARNNYIIHQMLTILNDDTSREEQYGRSNFEKITNGEDGANDIIDEISGEKSRVRSPYNPLDQLDYFEDAMGGARLKALSVNWDTFISRNNKVRAELSDIDTIDVVMVVDGKFADDSVITYDEKAIKESYGDDIIDYEEYKSARDALNVLRKERKSINSQKNDTKIKSEKSVIGVGDKTKNGNINETENISTPKPKDNKKRIVYKARKLGWSKNNRNVVGELITTYASQTTAHHLDAVKMGSVPNVNEYTFGVYKLLSSVGIDYETVIGFIRQPAITKIINNNNVINSVFFKSNSNPIKMTLNNLAIEYGLKINGKSITEFSKLYDVIDAIKNDSNISEAFENLFGIDISNMTNDKILYTKIPLDKEQLFARIKNNANHTGNVYENAAFDLGVILTFINFKRTANKINKYINATNVDKFGAKPSIRETRKHVELVEELRDDMTLSKDNSSFIDLIFPKTQDTNNIIVEDSEYPSIAAVHKYTALTSLQTNGKLFITEDNDFAQLEKDIQKRIGHIFTEAEYKEYKKYTMAYLYSQLPMLLSPIRLTNNGNIIINQSEFEDSYWDKERSRIYGYGIATDGNFKIENVNEPTEEELEKYYKLTPAQKVLFMQRHFPDNQGIFNYLKVTLLTPSDANYRGINRQYISYDDQIDSIEDLYIYFINSFSNHNPLIKLAAMDLVKYAFIAEGFNFKSGYISKITPNSILYTDIKNGGTSITDYITRAVENHPFNVFDINSNFIDNFVRSHSNITNIVRMGNLSNSFLSLSRVDGLIHIDTTTNNETVKQIINKLNLSNNVGNYVRINFFKGYNKFTKKPEHATILFKIVGDNYFTDENGDGYYQDYFLVPLNELDSYETYDYSYNQKNNRFASIDYYKDVIKMLAPAAKDARTKINTQNIKVDESIRSRVILEANKNVPANFKKVGAYTPEVEFDLRNDPYALMNAMEHGDKYTRDSVKKLINSAIDYLSRPEGERYKGYIQFNPAYQLNKLIPKGSVVDQIIDTENETYKLTITHLNLNQKSINNLKDKINGISESGEFEAAIEDIKKQEGSLYANHLYRVSITKTAEEELKETARKAVTDLAIYDTETAVHSPRRSIISADDVSSAIISEINYNARKNSKEMAKRFMNEMNHHRVNRFVAESREQNRKNIYKSAARYYKSVANEILNKLNKFELGLETYSMDDPKMYEALAEHSEQFSEVSDILLNGMTFGNRIETIFKLDLAAEDKETKEAIEEIINSINSVRQNTKLKHAMDNMINIYFQKYSTNPYIMSDFINLREAFGDLDVIDSWFTNPADIENSEVQTIVKQVYAMFSKAEMFDVERNIKEYKEELEKVKAINDSMDINKVIDFKNFKIRQGYNEQFLEDRQKIFDDYNEASVNKNNSPADFAKYLRAKYARDKFMYDNTEQRIEDEYYRRDLEMRDEVMRKAGDLYVQYMMLTNQLYNNNSLIIENDEETTNRKRIILGKLKMLKSNIDEVGSEKSPDVLAKVDALNKFLKERSKLQEEYFETKEYEGFTENYERYNNIVKHYNENHSQESLDKRLENAEYREAYDWIKNNGSLKFGKEESEKLRKAFKALTRRTTVFSNDTLTKLRKVEGLIDSAGQIDGRKLNAAQLKELHDEENSDLARAYDNGEGEIMLLKNVPGNIPIMKYIPNHFTGNLNAEQQRDLKKKKELIGKINNIIGKAYDRHTNSINLNILFNNDIVSFEERKELSDLYEELYNLGSEYKKRYWSAIKEKINKKKQEQGLPVKEEPYDELTYDEAFNTDMLYYKRNLMNTADGTLFLRIFCDKNGKANPYIYGYKMPKDYFIDTERTEAAKYINENIDFVPNEYYYLAMNEASENGTFDEWFKANHVYNPYTHKYQPLKIWTTLEAKPGSSLAESISYVPTFENMERNVKEDKLNNEENRKRKGLTGKGFQEFNTNYKKGNSKYDSNVTLNPKEEALRTLLTNIMNKYATTYQGKRFVGQGYLPRERKNEIDTRWVFTQTAALFGASWHSGADSDSFHRQVDFAHDREAEMNMLALIKGKGYQEYKHIPQKGTMTDEEYAKKLKEVREENRKIKEENEKVDVKNLNTNWEEVMEHFIHNATIFNSRQAAKPYLYLLLEDLKGNDAYAIKGRWNKRVLRDDAGTMTTPQSRTREIVHTLTRRLLFEQHHENSTPRTIANFLQNLTSAKYMIFNAYGGVANVTTGLVNIDMENQANEYFGYKEFMTAEKEYLSNIVGIISNLYSDTAGSLTQAFIKQFNVVNFDDILQFGSGTMNLDETLRKVRNWGYTFQSAGEHYMQNSVLLAMLKSNRLFTDHRGYRRIGDFKDYSWNIEQQAMFDVLKGNDELYTNYDLYLKSIKYDVDEKLNLVTNRKDYNRNYLYSLRDSIDENTQNLYKKVAEAYHKRREELLKEARDKFNQFDTVESLYDFKDGKAVLKKEKVDNFNKQGKNPIGDLEHLISEFREKVISVNQKIHGVYDKKGAAQIETKWWGSLVMQYHKHLWTGIMKRWRRRGYYSEFRGSQERGSYQTFIDFLGTEFTNFKGRVKNKQEQGENEALASIQVAMTSIINSFVNIGFNWNNFSEWERANMKRNLGDMKGVLVACLVVMALYGLYDDDDIKDDTFKSSLLYLADRLYSDSSMYSPIGLASEYKTAWSSPIASANGPSDLLKAMMIIPKALFDPEYDPKYQSGQYAGENKLMVLLRRNIPGVRPYDRIEHITKNNQYYKIGNSQIGVNIFKNFGETLHE